MKRRGGTPRESLNTEKEFNRSIIDSSPALENVVLVAMTGYGQATDREQSHDAGFDHHLVKPADFDQVQTILAAVAHNGRTDASAPS